MTTYALRFIDTIATYNQVAECAYYLWLEGSEDSTANWVRAEELILAQDDKKPAAV